MVDEQPTNQQPMSDDQELAKVLAGVNGQADDAAAAPVEEPVVTEQATEQPEEAAAPEEVPAEDNILPQPEVAPEQPDLSSRDMSAGDSGLDSIKQDALTELRPLVGKLQLAPEEKFDTYLLLLRSTDDKDLIAPAHDAAKNIPDETRRAQALLDIIKEIDFLSSNAPPA